MTITSVACLCQSSRFRQIDNFNLQCCICFESFNFRFSISNILASQTGECKEVADFPLTVNIS